MMLRRYNPSDFDFEFDPPIIMSHRVQQQYGTVVAGLCWLTYTFPPVTAALREHLAEAAVTRVRRA
jgi:arginine decarboxylase